MATTEKSLIGRIISIVIIAAVVVLVAMAILGIFRLINSSSGLSSAEKIEINISQSIIKSGDEVELTWEAKNVKDTGGSYRFSFDCDNRNITIRFLDEDGIKVISCGQDEEIVSKTIRLRAELSENDTYLDTNFYIKHVSNNQTLATGLVAVTVRSGESSGVTIDDGNVGDDAWATSTDSSNNNNNQNNNSNNQNNNSNTPTPTVVRRSDIYINNIIYGCLVNNTFVANQDCSIYYNNNNYYNNNSNTTWTNNYYPSNYNSYNQFDWFNTDVNNWLGYNLDTWTNTNINNWLNYNYNASDWTNYNTNNWNNYSYNYNSNYNYNNNLDYYFNNYTYYSVKPAIRFNIGNSGNLPTGAWQFVASVPTYDQRVITSGWKASLNPGEIMQFTLSMDSVAIGNNYAIFALTKTQNEISTSNNVGYVLTYGSRNYYNNY